MSVTAKTMISWLKFDLHNAIRGRAKGGFVHARQTHIRKTVTFFDTGHIPARDILVEERVIVEHVLHIAHRRDVPGVEILVEGGAVEHVIHIKNRRDVPGVDIFVERSWGIVKQ